MAKKRTGARRSGNPARRAEQDSQRAAARMLQGGGGYGELGQFDQMPVFGASRGLLPGAAPPEAWAELQRQCAAELPACPSCGGDLVYDADNGEEGFTSEGRLVLSMSAYCRAFDEAEDPDGPLDDEQEAAAVALLAGHAEGFFHFERSLDELLA